MDKLPDLWKILAALIGIGLAGAWFVNVDEAVEDVGVLKQIHIDITAKDKARKESCMEGLIEREWCIKRGFITVDD